MKYLLTLTFCLVLITSLSLKQDHEAVSAHQALSESHQNLTSAHDGVQAALLVAEAGIGIVSSAIDLAQKIADLFPVSCSTTGYKRENRVTLANNLNSTIKYGGQHQISGKVWNRGIYSIPKNGFSLWEFVKSAGSATGSCGILIYDIPNQKSLIIYFDNPWSSYNVAGVCIQNKISKISNNQMYDIYYKYYYSYQKSPKNCAFADNTSSKKTSFHEELQLNDSGFKVEASVSYSLVDKTGSNDCYNQDIAVVLSKA